MAKARAVETVKGQRIARTNTKSFLNVRAETTKLASYFEQFDKLRVTSDMSADDIQVEMVIVTSTATSHSARICIDYKHAFVDVQFVNKYTLVPLGRRQHVKSTEQLEALLRKQKVLVDAKLIRFENANDNQLLTVAKGEGFDDCTDHAGRAYWAGLDNGQLNAVERSQIINKLRSMGFKSLDITEPNWVVASNLEYKAPVIDIRKF